MNIVAHNHVLFSFPSIEVIHLLKLKTPFRIIPPFGYRLSKNRFFLATISGQMLLTQGTYYIVLWLYYVLMVIELFEWIKLQRTICNSFAEKPCRIAVVKGVCVYILVATQYQVIFPSLWLHRLNKTAGNDNIQFNYNISL